MPFVGLIMSLLNLPILIARSAKYRLGLLGGAVLRKLISVPFAEKILSERLQTDPNYWPYENIVLLFEIEKRLDALDDTVGSNRYLHHRWVMIFEDTMRSLKAYGVSLPDDFNYMCLGVGNRNPFALPFLFSLAGASHCYIVEPSPWGKVHSVYYGLQQMALRLLLGDIESEWIDTDVKFASRVKRFINADGFFLKNEVGDVLNKEHVTWIPDYLEDASIASESVDLISSRSVLEHIFEYEACFDTMWRILRPGGIMFHDIGLGAHSDKDEFEFYYHPKPHGEDKNNLQLNELRCSDYIREFEKRGFEVIVVRKTILTEYSLDEKRLQQRFAAYSSEDLLCEGVVLICKKMSR